LLLFTLYCNIRTVILQYSVLPYRNSENSINDSELLDKHYTTVQ